MGRGPTRFKKNEVARIIEGVRKTGAVGTFEFNLAVGTIRFHITGESADEPDAPSNPWDRVLRHGKAKSALAVLKKVSR
jgi:hypothetical protein